MEILLFYLLMGVFTVGLIVYRRGLPPSPWYALVAGLLWPVSLPSLLWYWKRS